MTVPNAPQGTAVPAAVAAIMAGLGTVDLGGATLMLTLPTQWPKIDAVCIAATDGNSPAIRDTTTLDKRTLGYQESFDIVCALWSWGSARGNVAAQARIDRCGELWDAVKAWVDANPTLSETVYWTSMGEQNPWMALDKGDGAQCTVGFSIHVIVSI